MGGLEAWVDERKEHKNGIQVNVQPYRMEPQGLNWLTCEDEEQCLGHRIVRTWSGLSDDKKNSSSQNWQQMNWEKNSPSWEGKSEEEGKDSRHPWITEGWRESSNGGKWKSRQYQRCHVEALGSSDMYDSTQQKSVGRGCLDVADTAVTERAEVEL